MMVPARDISVAVNRVRSESVSRYLNRFRIEEACRLLKETDDPIIKIMLEAGFLAGRSHKCPERRASKGTSDTDPFDADRLKLFDRECRPLQPHNDVYRPVDRRAYGANCIEARQSRRVQHIGARRSESLQATYRVVEVRHVPSRRGAMSERPRPRRPLFQQPVGNRISDAVRRQLRPRCCRRWRHYFGVSEFQERFSTNSARIDPRSPWPHPRLGSRQRWPGDADFTSH